MWSISLHRSFGSLSARRSTIFVPALLVALFTIFTVNTTSVQAQTPNETATWSGENIQYGGQTLERYDRPPDLTDERFPNRNNTPCRDSVPLFYSQPLDGPAVSYDDPEYREDRYWSSIICLAEGSDGSDKSEPISATLLDFSVLKEDISGDEPTGSDFSTFIQHSIQIYPEGTDPSGTETDDTITTCDSEYTQGIGWIICPVTRWLAKGMDALYGILEGFLTVSPVTENRSLYYVWGIMRNFANILFIVGFLIIIYSQTSSIGVSNYGIKRLLPRLILAAVLVNISYWVVAVAVDISNILGVSIKDLFDGIGQNLPRSEGEALSFDELTWESLAGFALSGGAAGLAIGGLAAGVALSVGASLYFLLPALLGVIVSALVAILVLAARQAIITILIVVAPLAFVAYLLPSTEKYFERWRSLFTTMLIIFPAFAVVFGGAQLAGTVIINSALDDPENPNFFNVIVLGMIVQVAPVIITPLLIKLGGSIIGRIAGIVNDPNKGIIDKSRQYAQKQHDYRKNSALWRKKDGDYANKNPVAGLARWNALRGIDRERRTKTLEGGLETAYVQSKKGREVQAQNEMNTILKSSGEDAGKAEFSRHVANSEQLRSVYYRQQVAHDEAEAESKAISTMYEGLKADPTTIARSALERNLGDRAEDADRRARSLASREATAKHVQERAYNKLITDAANTTEREFAGFSEIDSQGVARVVNIAQEAEAKSYASLVEAGQRALQREEATLEELEEIIEKGTSSNAKFAHFSGDIESRAAAIRQYMDTAPMKLRHKLAADMDLSRNAPRGTNEGVLRSEIAAALKKNKPFHISQTFLNQMAEGFLDPDLNGVPGRNKMVLDTLNKFAFDAEAMVSIDQDDIGAIADFFEKSAERASLGVDAEKQIIKALEEAFTVDRYKGRMGKRRYNLNRVRKSLGLPEIKE